MTVSQVGWRAVLQSLRPKEPASPEQYVRPARTCIEEVVGLLTADPGGREKVLLVGARGGGKSSELRAIARALDARGGALLATADLDASGVHAPTVTALDLLYFSALAVLRGMPGESRNALVTRLNTAYAGEQGGQLQDNVDRLAGFAMTASSVAAAGGALLKGVGVDIDPQAGLAAAGLAAVGSGLPLVRSVLLPEKRPAFVDDTSAQGSEMLEVCGKIAQARRQASAGRLYVVIDGLEKMNGEANERFRQIFEHTRLVADAPWAMVIAAPPCTITKTSSAMAVGYHPVTVWGFAPDDRGSLVQLVKKRFQNVGVDPAEAAEAGVIEFLVESSGSLPRHAIDVTWRAVLEVLGRGGDRLTRDDVERALQRYGEALGSGLTSEDLEVLAHVGRTGRLPGSERAAVLFADNRILSYPPARGSRLPTWAVHPLLARDVEIFADGAAKANEKP